MKKSHLESQNKNQLAGHSTAVVYKVREYKENNVKKR